MCQHCRNQTINVTKSSNLFSLNQIKHPDFIRETKGFLVLNFVTHDVLRMRGLNKLMNWQMKFRGYIPACSYMKLRPISNRHIIQGSEFWKRTSWLHKIVILSCLSG